MKELSRRELLKAVPGVGAFLGGDKKKPTDQEWKDAVSNIVVAHQFALTEHEGRITRLEEEVPGSSNLGKPKKGTT